MGSKSTHLLCAIACILIGSVLCQSDQDQVREEKMRVHREQQTIKDEVGLVYGSNTEIITFNISHMTDFIVKTPEVQEVKGNVYAYWKQDNAYIGSQYREGQNIRLLVYEDNYRILLDKKFYTTYGFKFNAEKDKVYTIRFVQNGKIQKIVSMQLSKTIPRTQDRASKEHLQNFSNRLSRIDSQVGMLSQISEFAVLVHEKAARAMNHSVCIYMTYLIVEAIVILFIVGFQVKTLIKLLGGSSIV